MSCVCVCVCIVVPATLSMDMHYHRENKNNFNRKIKDITGYGVNAWRPKHCFGDGVVVIVFSTASQVH